MKAILGLTAAAGLLVAATAASAVTYDFIDAIDNGPLGESYYGTFNTADYAYFTGPSISLRGWYQGEQKYAYADSGTAGFGVCRSVAAGTSAGANEGNTGNLCSPSSDDSIQSVNGSNEVLQVIFNEDTYLTSITLNANHDGPLTSADSIWIYADGSWTSVSANPVVNGYFTYNFDEIFSAGSYIAIGADCNQLYLSAMELSQVPLPAGGVLILTGVGALAAFRRRKKA